MKSAAVIFGRDWSARDAWPRARPHSPRGCASRSFQSLSYCGREKKGTACSLLYRRYTRKSQSSAAGRDYSGCETLGRRFLQHRPPVGALLVMWEPQVALQLDAGDELLSAVLAHELLVAHVLADVSAQALQLLVGFGTPLASATTRNALLFLHFARWFENEERTFFFSTLRAKASEQWGMHCYFCTSRGGLRTRNALFFYTSREGLRRMRNALLFLHFARWFENEEHTFFLHFARRLQKNEECTAISALRAVVWERGTHFFSTLRAKASEQWGMHCYFCTSRGGLSRTRNVLLFLQFRAVVQLVNALDERVVRLENTSDDPHVDSLAHGQTTVMNSRID